MKYKIGVIGDKESVLPFKLFGFSVFFATEEKGIKKALRHLLKEECGVIYITEDCAKQIPSEIAHYQKLPTPAIVLIPNHDGSLGIGLENVQQNVEKAVGQNIL